MVLIYYTGGMNAQQKYIRRMLILIAVMTAAVIVALVFVVYGFIRA